MFNFTTSESYVVAAGITSAGYMVLSRRQRVNTNLTVDSKTVLERVERRMDDLTTALQAHTADDAANFRELRSAVQPRQRRRSWLLPALGMLLRMFF